VQTWGTFLQGNKTYFTASNLNVGMSFRLVSGTSYTSFATIANYDTWDDKMMIDATTVKSVIAAKMPKVIVYDNATTITESQILLTNVPLLPLMDIELFSLNITGGDFEGCKWVREGQTTDPPIQEDYVIFGQHNATMYTIMPMELDTDKKWITYEYMDGCGNNVVAECGEHVKFDPATTIVHLTPIPRFAPM
jgi:hypothetical protein